MPPHPSTNFEMQKCYQNELKSNGAKGSLHTTIFSKYKELLQLKNIFRIF